MNKTIIGLLSIALVSWCMQTPVQAQDVEQVQKTLITKKTATWCSNCGSWGWSLFEDLIADNQEKAVLLAAHVSNSSSLYTAIADALVDNFDSVPGQPIFYANTNYFTGGSAVIRANIKAEVDAAYAQSPVAQTGIDMALSGNNLTVQVKSKFFEAADGDYYLAVYVVEDKVIAQQTGVGNNAIHKQILRSGITTASGEEIASGSIAAGTEVDREYTTALSGNWNTDNLEVVAVLWKKNGNNYEFVNVQSTTEFGFPTSTTPGQTAEFTAIVHTANNNTIEVNTNFPVAQPDLTAEVFNISGKKVGELYRGSIPAGQHQWTAEIPQAGMYIVRISSGETVKTEKIIVR